MRLPLRFAPILACLALASPASTQELPFDAYLQLVAAKAQAAGVSEQAIGAVLGGLQPNSRVIALDRDNISSPSRSGFPRLAPYLTQHNTRPRIVTGKSKYQQLGTTAGRIEREYGVPAAILLAIWGHETSYGAVRGNFDLPAALATLAWEGRRRELFEGELIDSMKMVDKGVPRSRLVGSWAGAFGNPQFLPSVYLRLAVDGDGDGQADIWNSEADTLASIANYFRDAGWRAGQPWGVRAAIPGGFDRDSVASHLVSPVCPRVHVRHSRWMSVREWREKGVIPQGYIAEEAIATLFEPDGPGTPAYLLTQNYRVILEYNCSNYYAMSVGLLADEIAR